MSNLREPTDKKRSPQFHGSPCAKVEMAKGRHVSAESSSSIIMIAANQGQLLQGADSDSVQNPLESEHVIERNQTAYRSSSDDQNDGAAL